jgi:ketosteroid isomerase-like protein
MPTPEPNGYAEQWVRAWNAHDIEAVLGHFSDDVVFTSPVAARVVPESGGVVRGKAALRDYWTTALNQQANLHFELIGVYSGGSTLVINYRNHRGQLVNEVLTFDGDGLVRVGHGTYLD